MKLHGQRNGYLIFFFNQNFTPRTSESKFKKFRRHYFQVISSISVLCAFEHIFQVGSETILVTAIAQITAMSNYKKPIQNIKSVLHKLLFLKNANDTMLLSVKNEILMNFEFF